MSASQYYSVSALIARSPSYVTALSSAEYICRSPSSSASLVSGYNSTMRFIICASTATSQPDNCTVIHRM